MSDGRSELKEVFLRRKIMDDYFNFSCIHCGLCCKKSFIAMTYFEYLKLKRIGKKIGKIPIFYMFKNHCSDWVVLMSAKPCPFLSADNRCTIYESRPTKCRMHPFNTTNNEDVIQEVDCPGWGGLKTTKMSDLKRDLVPYFSLWFAEFDRSNKKIEELIAKNKIKFRKMNRQIQLMDQKFDFFRFEIKK